VVELESPRLVRAELSLLSLAESDLVDFWSLDEVPEPDPERSRLRDEVSNEVSGKGASQKLCLASSPHDILLFGSLIHVLIIIYY